MLNVEKWYKMLLECDQLSKSFHFCHKSIFFLSFPLHCVSTQWKLLYQSEIILKNGICCCNKWKRMPSIRSAIYQTLRTPKICLNSRKNSINISDCPLLRTWWAWLGTRAHDTHIISCWSLKGILGRLWFMMGHAFSGQQYTTIIVRLLYIYIRIFRNGIFFSLLYWVDICFFSLVFFSLFLSQFVDFDIGTKGAARHTNNIKPTNHDTTTMIFFCHLPFAHHTQTPPSQNWQRSFTEPNTF